MTHRRSVLGAAIALIGTGMFSRLQAQAQPSAFSLPDFMLTKVPSGSRQGNAPGTTDQGILRSLSPPLLIPNLVSEGTSGINLFHRFDKVPNRDGTPNSLENRTVFDALSYLANDVQLSTRNLTASEKRELKDAYARLYIDPTHIVPTTESIGTKVFN
jgi:hypothetical protein